MEICACVAYAEAASAELGWLWRQCSSVPDPGRCCLRRAGVCRDGPAKESLRWRCNAGPVYRELGRCFWRYAVSRRLSPIAHFRAVPDRIEAVGVDQQIRVRPCRDPEESRQNSRVGMAAYRRLDFFCLLDVIGDSGLCVNDQEPFEDRPRVLPSEEKGGAVDVEDLDRGFS